MPWLAARYCSMSSSRSVRSSTQPSASRCSGAKPDSRAGTGAHLFWPQRQHVRDAVHHQTHHALAYIDHDHDGVRVVGCLRQLEPHAQVHEGNDGAAQVHHAQQVGRAVGQQGGFFVRADFLHAQDVHAVLLLAQFEGQECAEAGAVAGLGCRVDARGGGCTAWRETHDKCIKCVDFCNYINLINF